MAFHTPNGGDVAQDGTLVFTVPNSMNNRRLIQAGVIEEPVPNVIAAIDEDGGVSTWYSFTRDERDDLGTFRPMDAEFGPDGHLYVTDMTGSRVLRINVQGGSAIDADVVVRGLRRANGLTWKDDVLFVTSSGLARTEETDGTDARLISGVYAFSLSELGGVSVVLRPYDEEPRDGHLLVTLESSSTIGVGADGVAVGSGGNLYTSIFEDGTIYKTTLDPANRVVETVLHAMDERIVSADGIVFSPIDSQIYVADLLANAVHAVDLDGNVSTLYQNDDTTGEGGELDAPVALVMRGNQLIVMNQDFVAGSATRNTTTDQPFTISVFELR